MRHVERARGVRPVAVATRLLVRHERLPDGEGIEVVVRRVEERLGLGRQDARDEPLAQDAALRVAPVGGEAVADDRMPIAQHVGLDRDQADGHGRERDEGVADLRCDRRGGFADTGDAHGRPISLRRHAHAYRHHGKALAHQVDMAAQVVELVGVVARHTQDPHVRIDAVELGLQSLGVVIALRRCRACAPAP